MVRQAAQSAKIRPAICRGTRPGVNRTQRPGGLGIMNGAVRAPERQILTRCRLAEELIRRQLHGTGGWSHGSTQFATEPTAWALLALWAVPWASPATELGLTALMAHQGSDGLWPAVGYGA